MLRVPFRGRGCVCVSYLEPAVHCPVGVKGYPVVSVLRPVLCERWESGKHKGRAA